MFPSTHLGYHHGVLSDATLDHLITIFAAITTRPLSDDEGRLILSATGPALTELRNTRRKLSVISDLSEPDNVVLFPGAAA